MRDQTINDFLAQLADRVPAPGGGASAALHAAQGAALLGMVARYTSGEKYAEHEPAINRIRTETDELRTLALQLAEDDATAFTAVADAYRLPKGTEEEKAERKSAIAQATVGAAKPPAQVIVLTETLIGLAEEVLPIGNRNVVSDVAAAAEAIRAAAVTARINVEINLASIKDETAREELTAQAEQVDEIAKRADHVTAAVREEINK